MPRDVSELARRLARDAEAVCRHYLCNGRRQGRSCAGFRMPAMTGPPARSCGRRPKSAKARNRGRWCTDGATGSMGIWPRRQA